MKETKRRFESFMPFDYTSVERHLAKMAADGWRLEKVGNWFWTYRRAEPAKVTYAVTYAPDASDFNPGPTENQAMLEEYCAAAGWRKVSDWGKGQIYCTDREDPVPIETDEELRLQTIRSSMRKSIIPSYILLLVVFAMQTFTQVTSFRIDPVGYLAGSGLALLMLLVWGVVIDLGGLLFYWVWSFRSQRSIREGNGSCVRLRGYRTFEKITWVGLAVFTINLAFAFEARLAFFFVAYLAGMVLVVFAMGKTRDALKRRGVSKEWNIVAFIAVDILLVAAMIGGLVWGVLRHDWFEREPVEVIETSGWEWKLYRDDLPVKVEDFVEVDEAAKYSYEKEEKSSILLELTEYTQNAIPTGAEAPDLNYDVLEVKADFMYDFCLNARLRGYEDSMEEFNRVYYTEDAAAWGADAAYRLHYSKNGNPMDSWLVCKDDYIIRIKTDWELTEAQKGMVLGKLGLVNS